MTAQSKIEWTDATWNPVRGCTRVSEGCRNCYAEIMAARFSDPGQWGHGFAQRVTLPDGSADHRWTGRVALIESQLLLPLRWKKPRKIFVNSTSDLFHENLSDADIDRIFAVMALATQHTFQILTKRPERMRQYFANEDMKNHIAFRGILDVMNTWNPDWRNEPINGKHRSLAIRAADTWPLPNVWLGTSVEDQATANDRIPHLLATPAAIRFISAEPLLGPIKFDDLNQPLPDWVTASGETDPGSRPTHLDWMRSLRDQCADAGVPFFFNKWGEWVPCTLKANGVAYAVDGCSPVEAHKGDQPALFFQLNNWTTWDSITEFPANGMRRVGKKAAGRLLDGREHNEFPRAP